MTEPTSLGEIIARSGGPTPRKKQHKLKMLELNWERIAGERAGKRSRPTRLSRGVLTVTAEGPSWASELSMETDSLLRGVREVLGEDSVKKVRVRSSAGDEATQDSVAPARGGVGYEELPELTEETSNWLATIEEDDVRVALERLLRASIASKQIKQDGH